MGVISGTAVSLGYVLETTPGTTPTTPTLLLVRATGRNVNLRKDTLESNEVRTSRQRSDLRHGFNQVQGDITAELSLQAFNDLILLAMGGSTTGSTPNWFTPGNTGMTGTSIVLTSIDTSSATSKTALFTRGSGNFIDDGYRPGDYVLVANFPTAVNNGYWRIVAVTASTVTVATDATSLVPESGTAVPLSSMSYPGSKATIYGTNGSKLQTLTFERQFADGTNPVFEVFRGCAINTMRISMRPESLVEVTFGILGMTADINETATISTSSTYTSPPINPPLAGIDCRSFVGKFEQTVTGFEFTLDNQRTLLPILGSVFSPGVFEGIAKVSGVITTVMTQAAPFTNFQDEVAFSWAIKLAQAGSTNFMGISFYKVKPTAIDVDPPANGAILLNRPFEALENTFTGASTTYREVMHIQRLP